MKGTRFYTGIKYDIFFSAKRHETELNRGRLYWNLFLSFNLYNLLCRIGYYMRQNDTQNYQGFSAFVDKRFFLSEFPCVFEYTKI
jgi:hypothetical protein